MMRHLSIAIGLAATLVLSSSSSFAAEEAKFGSEQEAKAMLEKAVAAHAATPPRGAAPRPPHWSGFRVTPRDSEFWHSRLSRLHERIIFKRKAPGANWLKARLYP